MVTDQILLNVELKSPRRKAAQALASQASGVKNVHPVHSFFLNLRKRIKFMTSDVEVFSSCTNFKDCYLLN